MKRIVLGGGCFWGVEGYFQRLIGIHSTRVAYANGSIDNPSYKQVKKGDTNFCEVVELEYDENLITLETILDHLFRFIDPTSLNRQAEDEGTQYRTGIYYEVSVDRDIANAYLTKKQKNYDQPIVVEVKKLENIYEAEEYHQKYLDKNPTGYCHVNFGLLKPEELK
jgi:peptide-methionine (S)-S-oxide reductase